MQVALLHGHPRLRCLRGFLLVLCVCCLAAWRSPSGARADARQDAAYEAAIAEAVAHFSAAHWSEARALFLRAHEIKPSARTLRGLGVVEFELGHYAEA